MDPHRPLHLSPSSGPSPGARLSARWASRTPRHPGNAPSLILHSPFWTVPWADPQAASCIAAQPSVREGAPPAATPSQSLLPPPHCPGAGAGPLSTPQLKAPLPKSKHQSLLIVSPSSLSGLKTVAQAAPLWHLGAPQTLGWCLKNPDCLIPLHRELAQILSGPTPTRCRPGSPPL